jgi:hypothetical protein
MKNWITIVEDGGRDMKAHFPIAGVTLVLEVQDRFSIHFEKGKINVEGDGVEKLVAGLLSDGEPVLKSGVAGIKSVKYDRGV